MRTTSLHATPAPVGPLVVRLSIVLIALAAVFLLVGGEVDAREPERLVVHRVVAGDTLWDLAADAGGSAGLLETVDAIRRLNDLEDSTLQIGQELRIPDL